MGDGKPCKKCGTSEWYKHGGCKRCARIRAKRWFEENYERARETRRRYYENNLHRERRKRREYERKHADESNERLRRWKKNNKDKVNAETQKRRARIAGNGGSYTAAEWKAVKRQQRGRCLACGKKAKLEIDHVIPVSMGGSNDISNIQGLCRTCNASKGARYIDYRPERKGIKHWIQRSLFPKDD